MPNSLSTALRRWFRLHVLSLIIPAVLGLGAPEFVHAQALSCPSTYRSVIPAAPRNPQSLRESAQLPINLQADSWDATINGEINLTGKVQAVQGERTLSADALHYNTSSKDLVAEGAVQYEDSALQLSGTDASMDSNGGAEVAQANFMLKGNSGRGTATKIQLSPDGNVALEDVRYTTCPPGSVDWELKLSDLDIDQQSRTGTGRNVRLEFQGVPIFYTPWITFPVGNQRKSGFLFPSFGGSSRGGNSLAVPWYWNLASNYDDTITPIFDTSRGFKLDNEFRYMDESSKGTLVTGYLPYDNQTQDWRGFAELQYRNDLTDTVRLNIDASEVRDNEWFEDFGKTGEATSTVFLTRLLSLSAHGNQWRGELNFQDLQVIDSNIALADRPYTVLPQLAVDGYQSLPFGGEFALNSELSYFTRGAVDAATNTASVTGARLYLLPQLSLPLRTQGMYVIPSASWHYSRYQLQDTTTGAPKDPGISAPIYSLDTGLVFERLSGSKRQRLYTLEPRLLYTYVPYRAQSDVPLFDTDIPDFSLVQLYQSNRFLGPDRLGDANQLATGVTTRMLDSRDGRQFLSGTLGQTFYFKTPCITSLTALTCDSNTPAPRSSNLIGLISLSAYKNWSAGAGVEWNPNQSRSERGDLSFQYNPGPDRTVNLGYSYDRDAVQQWVTSFAWPLRRDWSSYGRAVYSQLDSKFLAYHGGLEYRSCCWNIRAIAGRSVTTRTGEYDTQYLIQLELKGLSSVGTADAFLESAIPGYSARGR